MVSSTDSAMSSIHRMLNPASIAVVGATPRLQYGGRFLKAALRSSDGVRVYPVNPRYGEVMGVRCYPSLAHLPESPDLVGIVVPYDRVMGVLDECVKCEAGSAIVISAGFAERGVDERSDLQKRMGELALSSGVRVCGPNCLGVANLRTGIWATASSLAADGRSGPIGLVSQSGASAFGPFLARALEKGIGYSYIVSTGNEADLGSADFIRYLVDDPHTKVIACFIEGFKDGARLMEAARAARQRGKPIVMIKVGRSELGSRAAGSHTAALSGEDTVHDAAFRQLGIVRVDDYDDLIEVSQLMAFSPAPGVPGVSVVSHSGGISSLAADNCGQVGLSLPPLSERTVQGLNEVLKGFGWASNPADVTGHANSDNFPRVLDLMSADPEMGTVVVASAGPDSQARQIVDLRDRMSKPVVFLWTGSQSDTDGLDLLKSSNIPVFYQPGTVARGVKALIEYHRRRDIHTRAGAPSAAEPSMEQRREVERLSSLGEHTLSEHETKGLLALWGVPVTREKRVDTLEDACAAAMELGYPVALKVESPDVLHKTDAGLVELDVGGAADLRQAYDALLVNARHKHPGARISGVLVQEMVSGGTEVIVGVFRDPQFGPVLLLGMGGVLVELYRDVALRVCPITREDAKEMLSEVRGARVLEGYRGIPPGDVEALIDTLIDVSTMAVHLRDSIRELDINPLTVLPRGQGVKALDALAVLGS